MIVIPFVYFSILGLFFYKQRKTVDIAVYICILFAVTGLLSICVDILGLRGEEMESYVISPFAAFVYCGLLSLCLLPFFTFTNTSIKEIEPVKNVKLLKIIAWLAFLWFLMYVLFSYHSFYSIITGDLAELRAALYRGEGDDSYLASLPGPIRIVMVVFNLAFGCYWIFIFLALYSLLIQKLPVIYFFLFIFASLSGPWSSILGVDRSGIAYYFLVFVGLFIFFIPFMSYKQKKNIAVLSVLFVTIFGAYIVMNTISRFGGDFEESDAVQESLIGYLGQSYINFCYFFDTFDSPWKTTNLLFPFTNKYVLGDDLVGGTLLQHYIEDKTGVTLGVFYTYIGHILVTAGHLVAVLFCFVYTVISYLMIYRIREGVVSIGTAFNYTFMSSFMILGLFAYFYGSPNVNSSILFFFVVIKLLNWTKQEDNLVEETIQT